jgi:hypothetical protein
MEKFENYHRPERHHTHGPGAKWIEKPVVGFGVPTATVKLNRRDTHYATVDTI